MAERFSFSEKVRGAGVNFDRIRRITGYLVGTLDRFNSGKRAEVNDRVKHGLTYDIEPLNTLKGDEDIE